MVPVAKLAGLGVTAMEVTVFEEAVTVSADDPETPFKVAEMEAVPAETPVAKPEALTVATALFVEAHVAIEVMLEVEPSL